MIQQHHIGGKETKCRAQNILIAFNRFSQPAEGVFSSLPNLKSGMGIRLSAEQNVSLKDLS